MWVPLEEGHFVTQLTDLIIKEGKSIGWLAESRHDKNQNWSLHHRWHPRAIQEVHINMDILINISLHMQDACMHMDKLITLRKK